MPTDEHFDKQLLVDDIIEAINAEIAAVKSQGHASFQVVVDALERVKARVEGE